MNADLKQREKILERQLMIVADAIILFIHYQCRLLKPYIMLCLLVTRLAMIFTTYCVAGQRKHWRYSIGVQLVSIALSRLKRLHEHGLGSYGH